MRGAERVDVQLFVLAGRFLIIGELTDDICHVVHGRVSADSGARTRSALEGGYFLLLASLGLAAVHHVLHGLLLGGAIVLDPRVHQHILVGWSALGVWVKHRANKRDEILREVDLFLVSFKERSFVFQEQLVKFILLDNGGSLCYLTNTLEGSTASQHREKHDTEGVDVNADAAVFSTLNNLRSHVTRRSQD